MHSISYWNGWTYTSIRKRRICAGSRAGEFCQSGLAERETGREERLLGRLRVEPAIFTSDESIPVSVHPRCCRAFRRRALPRTDNGQRQRREPLFMLRVFGRLPVTDSAARSKGRRPKSLRGGNRGGVCGGSGVGLWGF